MNATQPILDGLFELLNNRQENPIRISRGRLNCFAVRLNNGLHSETMIIAERDTVLSLSMRWLNLDDLEDTQRKQIVESARSSTDQPYNAVFLALDRGITRLWARYRAICSPDPEVTLAQYDDACFILAQHIGQKVKWQDILVARQFFRDDL